MMLCPICAGAFHVGCDVCPVCDCALVPCSVKERDPLPSSDTQHAELRFVELCRPALHPVAMLIKEMLEVNGVAAVIKGSNALSLLPHLAFGGELRVLVAREHLEFARVLYRAYFESDGETDFAVED